MKQELIQLMQEYQQYCEDETKKLQKKQKGMIVAVSFSFAGFFEWLKSKE